MSLISDRLILLADCLCQQIKDAGLPETCFCGVIPGDAAVGEYAGDCNDKCGMAWVRLATMYPSVTPGVVDETSNNCSSGLGFDVEVGIMRCIRIPEDGSPLPPGELMETTILQTSDAEVIWRAILCCPGLPRKDLRLGGYTAIGPMGGLVGGSWSVSVAI